MRRRILLILVLLLASSGMDAARAFFGFGDKPQLPPAAAVGSTSGDAEFQTQGSASWDPAAVGRRLKPGDRVRTQADGIATVAFSGGSIVEIRGSADLGVETLDPKTIRVAIHSGLLRAWVVKMEGQSFEVRSPDVTAATPGARFGMDVSAQGPAVVNVHEGTVDLESGGKTSRAAAGQRMTTNGKGVLGPAVSIPPTAASFPPPPQALIPTPRPAPPPAPPKPTQAQSDADLKLPPAQPINTISPSSP